MKKFLRSHKRLFKIFFIFFSKKKLKFSIFKYISFNEKIKDFNRILFLRSYKNRFVCDIISGAIRAIKVEFSRANSRKIFQGSFKDFPMMIRIANVNFLKKC